MTTTTNCALRRALAAAPLALGLLTLAGCGDDDNDVMMPPPVAPAPAPAPPPATFNVARCVNQVIPGTGGVTVVQAIAPDTLTLNLAAASGFPNGRRLPDPVIDVTLGVIFLDLTRHSPATFAMLPLNPPANDRPFPAAFPYLAPPQGTPPLSGTAGQVFNFRSDPLSAYVRVDRMGMPAVSTALIPSARKNAYNDANPVDDVGGAFLPEITGTLTALTNALADDLGRASLTPCATPS